MKEIFKVVSIESKKYKDCEYCEKKGYKSIEFFEEFNQGNTTLTYLCPACGGYKKQEDERTEISYSKSKVKFISEQTLIINGEEMVFNMEGEQGNGFGQDFIYGKTLTKKYAKGYENQFGGENVGEEEDEWPERYELVINGELFYLIPKKDMGITYFYFDTEEEADKFIEEKEKIIL